VSHLKLGYLQIQCFHSSGASGGELGSDAISNTKHQHDLFYQIFNHMIIIMGIHHVSWDINAYSVL